MDCPNNTASAPDGKASIPPDSSSLDACPDCGTLYGGCVCHSSDSANPWRDPRREPSYDMDRCEMDEQRAWKAGRR